MDELWFVNVPIDVAVERLVNRHVASGLSPDANHARTRIMASDMQNGQLVLDHRLHIQEIIQSIEHDAWKAKPFDIQDATGKMERPGTNRLGSLTDLAIKGGGVLKTESTEG